jgi:hypothetical protein
VDPQHLPERGAQAVGVGRGRAVAGRHVEVAVRPKLNRPTVVVAGRMGDRDHRVAVRGRRVRLVPAGGPQLVDAHVSGEIGEVDVEQTAALEVGEKAIDSSRRSPSVLTSPLRLTNGVSSTVPSRTTLIVPSRSTTYRRWTSPGAAVTEVGALKSRPRTGGSRPGRSPGPRPAPPTRRSTTAGDAGPPAPSDPTLGAAPTNTPRDFCLAASARTWPRGECAGR